MTPAGRLAESWKASAWVGCGKRVKRPSSSIALAPAPISSPGWAIMTRVPDHEDFIAAIEAQTSLDGVTARERLRAIIRLYSERMNTDAMAIELAIRQWARGDEKAANAVASVDAARLKNVGQLYRATGLEAEEADAQAFLFYSFMFGQSLLFLERGPRKRAQLVAKSAGKLVDDET